MEIIRKIVWSTLDSADGERTLKQHAYIEAERNPSWNHAKKYMGNIQLCNHKGGAHDGDKFLSLEEIDSEIIDINNCCKKCLKIYKKLKTSHL